MTKLSIQRSGLSHHYDQAIENLLEHWDTNILQMKSNNSIIDYPDEIEALYKEIRLALISLKQNEQAIQDKVQRITKASAKNAAEYYKHITEIITKNCLLSQASSKYIAILNEEILEFQQIVESRLDNHYQKLISLSSREHENSISAHENSRSTIRIERSLIQDLNLLKHGKLLHIEYETIKEEEFSQSSSPHKQDMTQNMSYLTSEIIEEYSAITTSTYSETHSEEAIDHLSLREQLVIFNDNILRSYGMHSVNFPSDNNSFFHAIVNQLNRLGYSTYTADYLRELAITYFNSHPDEIEGFTTESVDAYILHILTSGTWDDNPLLQSLSQLLGINIAIITDNNQNSRQIVEGRSQQEVIYLGHLTDFHYVALEMQTSSSSSAISTDLETNSGNLTYNYEDNICTVTGLASFEGNTSNQIYPFQEFYDSPPS